MKNELTDLEISKLIVLNKDKVLVEALRKVFLATIYSNGTLRKGIDSDPLKNAALSLVASAKSISNEELGADLKALWEGINTVEQAFDYLATLRDEQPTETAETNEAI